MVCSLQYCCVNAVMICLCSTMYLVNQHGHGILFESSIIIMLIQWMNLIWIWLIQM